MTEYEREVLVSDQMDLFNDENPKIIDRFGGSLVLHRFFLKKETADDYLKILFKETPWKQEEIKMFGNVHPIPRLTAWYGDPGSSYVYSGVRNEPLQWTPTLDEIRTELISFTGQPFNSLLMNLYRDGNDSVAWHADDEPELGESPFIASLSLGSSRPFQVKPQNGDGKAISIELMHGDLLTMSAETQSKCLHQIPKTSKTITERINLTFRNVSKTDRHNGNKIN